MKTIKMLFRFAFISLTIVTFLSCNSLSFSTKLIRKVFDKEGMRSNKALEKHVSKEVISIYNQHYDTNNKDSFLDVYYPVNFKENKYLQTIVWIHGGAWIAGDKNQLSNYCKILAGKGYTVVAVNYSLAPKKTYPTPVIQINKALTYLVENAKRFHIDSSQFILAGDSGGAHIAAQSANLISVQSYASLLNIKPSINKSQLAGTILFCGPYDAENIDLNGNSSKFLNIILQIYSGSKDFKNTLHFKTASVINYVTKEFPPSFISVGNGDPLASHSYNLAKKLTEIGVNTDTLFWEKDYIPALPHEYQFNLDTEEGNLAMENLHKFLKKIKK